MNFFYTEKFTINKDRNDMDGNIFIFTDTKFWLTNNLFFSF